jgi:hypothetical protein
VLILADVVSVLEYGIGHHVKMEPIGVLLVIVLVHTLVQHIGTLSYLFDIRPVLFHTGLKFLLGH